MAILVFMPVHPPLPNKSLAGLSRARRWLSLDWIGAALSLTVTTCFILPLQWGGITRPWNDKVVISLFSVVSSI
jgi:hypothetical protein